MTDLRQVHLEDITAHYATTLARWRERFLDASERLADLGYDERFRRLWELYLSYCEGGFRERRIQDVQLLLAKPGYRAEQTPGSVPRCMKRTLYEDVHEDFRASFRTFLEREVLGEEGRYGEWERAGIVPREVFALAGRGGFLGMSVPERYGGAGAEDFRFNLIIGEETQRAGVGGFGLGITLHNDICLPYFLTLLQRVPARALAARDRLR